MALNEQSKESESNAEIIAAQEKEIKRMKQEIAAMKEEKEQQFQEEMRHLYSYMVELNRKQSIIMSSLEDIKDLIKGEKGNKGQKKDEEQNKRKGQDEYIMYAPPRKKFKKDPSRNHTAECKGDEWINTGLGFSYENYKCKCPK